MLRFVFSLGRRPLLDPADLPRSKLTPRETPVVQTGAQTGALHITPSEEHIYFYYMAAKNEHSYLSFLFRLLCSPESQ